MFRKLIIFFSGLIFIAAVYFAYITFVDSPAILVEDDRDVTDNTGQGFDPAGAGSIDGSTAIGQIEPSNFVEYDPVTKQVKRIFGFEKVLNPEAGSSLWKLEKPYMKIYDSGELIADVTSDRGSVQVQSDSGKVTPTDAKLIDNVIIELYSDQATGTIRMDQLSYYSDRSEFSTDGPVTVASQSGYMKGDGLTMIYNPAMTRLEYLRIVDLDFMWIKDIDAYSSDDKAPAPATAKDDPVVAKSDAPAQSKEEIEDPSTDPAADKKAEHYKAVLDDNVEITYGNHIIVSGSEKVSINNIMFGKSEPKSESTSDETVQETTSTETAAATTPDTENKTPKSADAKPTLAPAIPDIANLGENDILIRCDGGIIVQPMISHFGTNNTSLSMARTIEFLGSPVQVKQPATSDDIEQKIADCGRLRYDFDRDSLDMFTTEKQQQIVLNMADSDAGVQTEGSVQWLRSQNQATIVGPGKLTVNSEPVATEKVNRTELDFPGIMQLYFAELPADQPEGEASLGLSSVNLAGGLDATFFQETVSHLSARTATLLFNESNDIVSADIKGDVKFDSEQGNLESDHTQILFATDDTGSVYAKSIHSPVPATLIPVVVSNTTAKAQPAIFQAQAIDYEMATGEAIAHGPVKFTYYYTDPNTADATPIPMTITAKENAKYSAAKKQITFNRDVVGTSTETTPTYVQTSTFKSPKMIVDLAENELGNTTISNVAITGPNARLESKRMAGDELRNHISLTTAHVDYNALEKTITASGPGIIKINNQPQQAIATETTDADTQDTPDERISLKKPCYAIVEGFDKLTWYTEASRILAGSKDKQLLIAYIPMENGQPGKRTTVTTSKMQADFMDSPTGQSEISTLTATGKIIYEEQDENYFEGDNLFFDAAKSMVTVKGSEQNPCILNGVPLEQLEYNPATGDFKTQMSTSSGAIKRK